VIDVAFASFSPTRTECQYVKNVPIYTEVATLNLGIYRLCRKYLTMAYLHLDLNLRRQIQKGFIHYMESVITLDPKIEELLQWESDKDMIAWLDNL